jgi:hypothetical protein
VREQSSAGASFRYQNWQIDYAYLNHTLGGTNVLSATVRFGVPYGVKLHRNRGLFSPSGSDHDVDFGIATAVQGRIENWRLEIIDHEGNTVRTFAGNGAPPEEVSWSGQDDAGRLVGDGDYRIKVSVLDDMGEEWEFDTNVQILGFRERTRKPIRIEISGSGDDEGGRRP